MVSDRAVADGCLEKVSQAPFGYRCVRLSRLRGAKACIWGEEYFASAFEKGRFLCMLELRESGSLLYVSW